MDPSVGVASPLRAQRARKIHTSVICDLFGVPRENRRDLTRWSEDILTLLFGAMQSPDRHERAERGMREFSEFLQGVIAERRARPGEDLVSDLVAARERGDVLDDEEIVATCVLMLFAGHETTRNLLANGLKAILQCPSAQPDWPPTRPWRPTPSRRFSASTDP